MFEVSKTKQLQFCSIQTSEWVVKLSFELSLLSPFRQCLLQSTDIIRYPRHTFILCAVVHGPWSVNSRLLLFYDSQARIPRSSIGGQRRVNMDALYTGHVTILLMTATERGITPCMDRSHARIGMMIMCISSQTILWTIMWRIRPRNPPKEGTCSSVVEIFPTFHVFGGLWSIKPRHTLGFLHYHSVIRCCGKNDLRIWSFIGTYFNDSKFTEILWKFAQFWPLMSRTLSSFSVPEAVGEGPQTRDGLSENLEKITWYRLSCDSTEGGERKSTQELEEW